MIFHQLPEVIWRLPGGDFRPVQSLSSRPGRSLSSAFKSGEVNKKLVSRAAPNNRTHRYIRNIYIYMYMYIYTDVVASHWTMLIVIYLYIYNLLYIYIYSAYTYSPDSAVRTGAGFKCPGGALPYQQCGRGYFANETGMILGSHLWRGSRGPLDHEKVPPYDLNRFDLVIVRRSQAADELSCSSDQPWPLFSWTSISLGTPPRIPQETI